MMVATMVVRMEIGTVDVSVELMAVMLVALMVVVMEFLRADKKVELLVELLVVRKAPQ